MTVWDRTRTRSTGGFTATACVVSRALGTLEHGYNAPYQGPTTSWVNLGQTVTETTSDMVNKSFKRRMENGEIINSPFTTSKTIVTDQTSPSAFELVVRDKVGYGQACYISPHNGTVHRMLDKQSGTWRPARPTSGLPALALSARQALRDSVKSLAVTQAHANIDESEMLALATLAESGKTIDSVQAILWRAYKIFRNVRRLNIRGLREELSPKEIANRWMEARYALRPLMYDLRGTVNALEKVRGRTRRSYYGYAEDSMSTQLNINNLATGITYLYGNWLCKAEYVVSAKAGVLCDVNITDASVFGFDQLLETGWELLPFSFIADWFANTGDWIAAHTPNAGVRQLASWVTCKESYKVTSSSVSFSTAGIPSTRELYSLVMPHRVYTTEELVLTRDTEPSLSVFPSAKLNLDTFKITDLGIIIRNILK